MTREVLSRVQALDQLPWGLWWRQVRAVVRLEIGKSFRGRRALGVYLLAAAPVFIFAMKAFIVNPEGDLQKLGTQATIFAVVFRTFMLRFVIFFGCVSIFCNLVRGDVLEKTLHYYFLTPVRREVLSIGKYLSGLCAAFMLLGTSVTASFLLHYWASGAAAFQQFFATGPGIGHLLAYLGVVLLACIGYGAVFQFIGQVVRNPIIPAAIILGWESINFLLPPVLKKISVIYYLESLCPVPLPPGPITLLADPAPTWVAVPGLVIVTLVFLTLSALRLREAEISYSSD